MAEASVSVRGNAYVARVSKRWGMGVTVIINGRYDDMNERDATDLCDALTEVLGDAQRAQCASVYAEAPEHDRRCVQRADHVATSPLHYNRAGFAWSDDEVLSAVVVDARERMARHLFVADSNPEDFAASYWDDGKASPAKRERYLRRADELLAVITGKEG